PSGPGGQDHDRAGYGRFRISGDRTQNAGGDGPRAVSRGGRNAEHGWGRPWVSLKSILTRGPSALRVLLAPTVQIERTPLVDDDQGGKKKGTPAIVATVAGNVQQAGRAPEEREIAARLAGRTLYRIAVPFGTDVQPDDVLIVGADRYQVVAPIDATLELTHIV